MPSKKIAEKGTSVHTGGEGGKKCPLFLVHQKGEKGTYSYGGGVKIFMSSVPNDRTYRIIHIGLCLSLLIFCKLPKVKDNEAKMHKLCGDRNTKMNMGQKI